MAQAGQSWPSGVIRLIAPVPAGGGADLICRQIAERVAVLFGARTIVENRPGATGLLAAKALARAAPDGQTFGYLGVAHATIQAMGAPIDLLRDFKPVCRIADSPYVLAVASDAPYKTLADLVDAARRSPGRLAYGTGGIGSRAHLSVEHLGSRAGKLELVHVPFKGANESLSALVNGDLGFAAAVLSTALPMLRTGRVRALAVTTAARVSLIPAVPTVAESGFAGYAYDTWGGLFAPAKTSDDVVARMADVVGRICREPGFRAFVEGTGSQLDPSSSPQAFRALIAQTIESESLLVRQLGLKLG